MAKESKIALPDDTTNAGKPIRSFVITETQAADGSLLDVYQQTMVLADPNGNVVFVRGEELKTKDQEVVELLQRVIVGQAAIIQALLNMNRSSQSNSFAETYMDDVLRDFGGD